MAKAMFNKKKKKNLM